ncbi:MAG: SdrD B-like domain-containing protein, partial [Actinomycetota bacterium]
AASAHTSAAYDLVVTDVLPEGVTFDAGSVVDNPAGGVFTAGTPTGSEGTITWTQTELAALAALAVGDTITIDYTVTVDDPAVASAMLTNTATVTAESRADDTAGERTSYTDDDTDTIELPAAQLAKDLEPFDADPFDGTDTDTTSFAVGEPIEFELTVAIASGTRAFDLTAFDDLPAFLEFEAYGTATDISATCERVGGGALTAGDVIGLTPDGGSLAWFLGDVVAVGGECRVTLPYTVHVDSVASTATSGANSSSLSWNRADDITTDPSAVSDVSGVTYDDDTGPETETVEIVEPLLAIDKDVEVLPGPAVCEASADSDACDTEAGAIHRFTVTVTNSGDGPAHDVTVVDTLPADGTGAPFNLTGSPSPVYSAGARTLTWDVVGPIAAAGGSVTFTYDITVGPSSVLENDEVLTNTAAVTSYWGLSESDREAGGSLINDDVPEYHVDRNPVTPDDVDLTVRFPDLVIEKTPAAGMDATDARVGEDFRWRLEVFNDGAVSAFDVDVTDTLPTDWLYEPGSATLDTGAGPVALADPAGGTAGPLVWTDVVAELDGGDSFVIEFDTQPQPALLTLATTGTFDHVNDSGVTGDDASGADGNADGDYGDDNGAPDGTHGSDDNSARIRRVDLELEKTILQSEPHFFGDFLTYRIIVTNNDDVVAVDTATGVTVRDVLPVGAVYNTSVTANGSYDDGTNIWTLTDPVGPGESVQLDIVVQINTLGTVVNIAEVETADQWDVDSTPGDHDEGTGPDEDDNDSIDFTPTAADIGNRLWFDVDADGVQDPFEPGIPGVDVTVSWIDPGSGLPVSQTFTTNAEGEYFFEGVPQNIDLTVTVDTADLPPGLRQTYELQDDPDITDTQAANRETPGSEDGVVTQIELTASTSEYLDVDFGYTGTGSIGDYVWHDLNGDGVQDGSEVGLDGVDITVRWGGFDGVIGDDPSTPGVDESFDDVVYTTTTAGGGLYGVSDLPPGPYRVTVDESDLPAGLDGPTWDPEFDASGDPADLGGVSEYTLGAGEDWDGVDFGYAGPGRIGDTVFIDLDGDGVQDPGEVGIPDVTVTVTFVEPGGGTINVVVDTDENGRYDVGGLPIGVPITVTVDPTDLPGNMVQTHDIDDPADGSSAAGTPDEATVTLTTDDPVNLDVDFGYRGLGTIGDTIWLDLDRSGETDPQADDVRLPNVEVTLTYTNPGGDDLVLVTTTGPDGTYRFENLPDGDYTVSVNPATLPVGVAPIVDPDGGDDNASSLTLDDDPGTVGVNEAIDLDQDFAYVGTGSIGDLVWNDVDELGSVDAGELGIPGVTVTAVWTDPVTGATTTLTTVTDADGEYRFENLPGGDYVVTIDPATLPEGMVPTYDLDGEEDGDRRVDVTLGNGEDRRDVDFGERREADLQIEKTSMGEWAVGAEERWTLTVTNNGPAIADGTITVTDDLPDGLTPLRHLGDDWSCTIAGQLVTCTYLPGPLAVGASSSLDVIVDVGAAAAPGVTNTARVAQDGGPTDPNPDNDTDDDSVVIPLAVLGVDKALVGELVSGEAATWRITVTNFGPSATTAAYTVVDELPTTLQFVRTEGDGWTCTVADRVVTCERTDVLAVGDAASVDIITIVDAEPGVQIANGAAVDGGTAVDGEPLDEDVIDEVIEEISTPDSELGDDLDLPDDVTPDTSTPDIPVLAFTGITFARLMALGLTLLAGGLGFVLLGARRGRHDELEYRTTT